MASNGKTVQIPIRRPRADLTCFTDIQESRLEWLWPGRIPLGKLSVIAGDPGLGKSLVTIAIAAAVTSEAKWPDCHEYAPHGSVILLSGEDDNSDTVKPRLRAAGADMDNVHSLSSVIINDDGSRRGLALDRDADLLREAIRSIPDCRLVVIDPLASFIGSVDSHKNADVRGLLSVLAETAQESRVAILYVSHLNKGTGGPMARITGSVAFVAAARSAMMVVRDPDDADRRIIFMPKCNLSKEVGGVAYRVRESRDNSKLPVVEWEQGFVDVDGETLLSSEGSNNRRERTEAAEWLVVELSAGPQLTTDLQSKAKQAGHAWRTVRRAQFELGVRPKRDGISGKWRWVLPGNE